MSESCRVRAYLLKEQDCGKQGWPVLDCRGPLVPCLLGVTKEDVEAKYPHGILNDARRGWVRWNLATWEPPSENLNRYLSLPAILHRLSTQECPECGGAGEVLLERAEADRRIEEWPECPTCSGTGRVGTVVCERHKQLLDDGTVRWQDIIPPENLALLQGLGLVESAGQVDAPAASHRPGAGHRE